MQTLGPIGGYRAMQAEPSLDAPEFWADEDDEHVDLVLHLTEAISELRSALSALKHGHDKIADQCIADAIDILGAERRVSPKVAQPEVSESSFGEFLEASAA